MIAVAVVEGKKKAARLSFVGERMVVGKCTAVGECTVAVDCIVEMKN